MPNDEPLGTRVPRPVPAGVEAPCAYLDQVLAFQAANGGPFARSLELEYAARRVARAWARAGLPERALGPWLDFAAASVSVPGGRVAAALGRALRTWAADECRSVPTAAPCTRNEAGRTTGCHILRTRRSA